MKDLIKLGGTLFLISAICAGLLGYINSVTTPIIEEQKIIAKENSMKTLITEAEKFTKVENLQSEEIVELYLAQAGNEVIGVIAEVKPEGYGGPVDLFVAVDSACSVKGVQVVEHSETPGLGANASKESFIGQYVGKIPPLNVVKTSPKEDEILAITGATITSRAVTKGVNDVVEYIKANESLWNGEGVK